jgi:hypothetical protein
MQLTKNKVAICVWYCPLNRKLLPNTDAHRTNRQATDYASRIGRLCCSQSLTEGVKLAKSINPKFEPENYVVKQGSKKKLSQMTQFFLLCSLERKHVFCIISIFSGLKILYRCTRPYCWKNYFSVGRHVWGEVCGEGDGRRGCVSEGV